MKDGASEGSSFMKLMEKTRDKETRMFWGKTIKNFERMAVLRFSAIHVNMWTRQLETKRNEIRELTELLRVDEIKKEIEKESLVKWGNKANNILARKTKRMIYEEIDNMVWNGSEQEIGEWCNLNKVFDEITEEEIEEIQKRDQDDNDEAIRLNGKYVWETAKRVCDFISSHEELIHITTFREYRNVMRKVMGVIK